MRIACLQINPLLGKLQQNISKANHIIETSLSKLDKPFDFLILPELALTGYNFPNKVAIEPYLEQRSKGPSSKWAMEVSQKHKCFTLVGYPEWDDHEQKIFNSAILTGPDGSVIHHYRKSFLYESDENWGCSENPSKQLFEPFDLVLNKSYYLDGARAERSIKTNIGICMDLNPYKFEAPFNKFEFSLTCFENQAKLILCPMAWLSPLSPSIAEDKSNKVPIAQAADVQYDITTNSSTNTDTTTAAKIDETNGAAGQEARLPEMSTVNYWVLRFLPFLRHPMVDLPRYYKNVTLVCCNRAGQEGDVLYGGSSSIFQFRSDAVPSLETGVANESVAYYGSLGTAQEGIIVRDVDLEE